MQEKFQHLRVFVAVKVNTKMLMGYITLVNTVVVFAGAGKDHVSPGERIQIFIYKKGNISRKIDIDFKFVVGMQTVLLKRSFGDGFAIVDLKIKRIQGRNC